MNIHQIDDISDYVRYLQESDREATVLLKDIIPLKASDTGRPIRHLASTLIDADLTDYGEQVLRDLGTREAEVATKDGRTYVMRVRPYRTTSNVIDGVVITFEEITSRKRVEQALIESEEPYHMLFEMASDSIVLVDAQTGAIVEFKRRAHEHLGYARDEFSKLAIADIEATEPALDVANNLEKVANRGSGTFKIKHRTKGGGILDIQVNARTISIGEKTFLLSTWHDITRTDAEGQPSQ